MNPAIIKALLGEQLKRTLPIFVLASGITVVSSLVAYFDYLRIDDPIQGDLTAATGMAIGGIVLAHFCAIISLLYSYSDDRDLNLTMPAHLLRLPVRTVELVFWRLGYSVVFIAIIGLISSSCFYALFSNEFGSREITAEFLPFWIPIQAGVTLFVCLQALAWTIGGSGAVVTGVACTLYILIVGLLNDFDETLFDSAMYDGPAVPITIAVACLISWTGVTLRRRGMMDLDNAFAGILPKRGDRREGDLPPFKSPEAAMRWLEWRRQGWKFVVFVIVLSVTLGIMGIRGNPAIEVLEWPASTVRAFQAEVVAFSFYMALCLAVFMFGAYSLFQNQRIQLGPQKSFLFIRPASTRSLASARLTVTVRSLLLGMLPVVIISLVAITLAFRTLDEVSIKKMIERYAEFQAVTILAFLLVGLFGAMWCVQWSGNGLALLGLFSIPLIVMQILPAFNSLEASQLETYAMRTTAIIAIPAALYLFYRARREGLLNRKTLIPWLIAWPFILGGFLTFSNWTNIEDGNPFVLFGESAPILAVAVLPILPLATVPLIMQYARHR